MNPSTLLPAAALCAAATLAAFAEDGTDFHFGGDGDGNGKLKVIRDLAFFGPEDHVYALDAGPYSSYHTPEFEGNGLVQVFTREGQFVRQFPVRDETLGGQDKPGRMALDKSGNVFISQPELGEVWKFDAKGGRVARIPYPGAYALASCARSGMDMIAVAPRLPNHRAKDDPEVALIDAASAKITRRVKLSVPIPVCVSLAVDSKANIYALSQETAQCLKFSPQGKLIAALGGGVQGSYTEGGVFEESILLDSKDNLYSWSRQNLVKIDPGLTTLRLRGDNGFEFGRPWVDAGGITPLAFDSKDQLWIGSNGKPDGRRPAIVRAIPDIFEKRRRAKEISAFSIGLKGAVTSPLPYDISHEPGKPLKMDFTVAPAYRRVNSVTVEYNVYDLFKKEIAKGRFELPLKDAEEAKASFQFTPPAHGWYAVLCKLSHKGVDLGTEARNIGVTPRFPGMPDAREGGFDGDSWNDIPRQAFAGLMLHRTTASVSPDGPDNLEKVMKQAAENPGMEIIAHFTNVEDSRVPNVRRFAERFKGRVKYWEFVNEPNLGHVGPPEKFVELMRDAAPLIRELDPAAKILGPNTCGIDIGWIRRFLELGGGDLIDILSIHDYEGHETLDPVHWHWKYGELRRLMEEFGIADKPVWQTERGWLGIRGNSFLPLGQAVRFALHRDTLEILGIPSENNFYYYLNNGGYGDYPAFMWSDSGPHPAVMAARMREAQVRGKKFEAALDFGAAGAGVFQGLRFSGADADLYIVRNLGLPQEYPVAFTLKGANSVVVMDWAGNSRNAAAAGGKLTLPLSQLPAYVRVPKGAALAPQPVDFGQNIAADATVTASLNGRVESLNNGVIETTHHGNPVGGTGGESLYNVEAAAFPQTIDFTFPAPREVNRMVVRGIRADNAFCALLDFDVQCNLNGKWTTIKSARRGLPLSEMGKTPNAMSYSWIDDTNMYIVPFDKPVKAAQFRLSINRVSYGLLADDPVALHSWGGEFGKRLCLREVEIYGK